MSHNKSVGNRPTIHINAPHVCSIPTERHRRCGRSSRSYLPPANRTRIARGLSGIARSFYSRSAKKAAAFSRSRKTVMAAWAALPTWPEIVAVRRFSGLSFCTYRRTHYPERDLTADAVYGHRDGVPGKWTRGNRPGVRKEPDEVECGHSSVYRRQYISRGLDKPPVEGGAQLQVTAGRDAGRSTGGKMVGPYMYRRKGYGPGRQPVRLCVLGGNEGREITTRAAHAGILRTVRASRDGC